MEKIKGMARGLLESKIYYPKIDNPPLPSRIMVEPSGVCNYKCSICYTQQQLQGVRILLFEDYKKILSQFSGINELIFCGIGETLLNKDIFQMIKFASINKVPFISLVSNGSLIDEDCASKIIESSLNMMQISVHSFKPAIFEHITNETADTLEKVIRNIRYLIALKNKKNSILKICLNSVVTKFNFMDLCEFVKEAASLGADKVEFLQMSTYGEVLQGVNAPVGKMTDILKEARSTARRAGIEIGFLSGNCFGRCYQLWDFVMVHADGSISPCNGIFPTDTIKIGNMLKMPFEGMWYSETYKMLRKKVIRGELSYCRFCESGYLLEGKNFMWFKNHYIRPLKRIIKRFLRNGKNS